MTRRDPLLLVGLGAVWLAAMVASFATLASLAGVAGWAGRSAWLLPACIDALGMAAGRVWMSPKAPERSRVYARAVTLVAVGLSVLGNAAGHMVGTGYLRPGLVLVVLVGAVPPVSLAGVVHLAVLVWAPVPIRKARTKTALVSTEAIPPPTSAAPAEPAPAARPQKAKPSRRPVGEPDELLEQRARHAAEKHLAEHQRPISRDGLKAELGISSARASQVLAKLKEGAA